MPRSAARSTVKRPQITAEGFQRISERVADIRERRLPELVPLLVETDRDERYVHEYEQLLAEAHEWEGFLAEAQVLNTADSQAGVVNLGTRALVTLVDGTDAWVRPVHPREAFLDDERISMDSPLGKAIIGARCGDAVEVDSPVGTWQAVIREIEV
ncbi:MAG: GreA/GreB family elongation factor [Actinomycetales bacterium]